MPSGSKENTNPSKLKLHLLVLRCQTGEGSAFKELHGLFANRTLRFLTSFVSGPEAEDLNQELWLAVYNRIASLYNVNGFKTWLFQAARNKALDYLRRGNRLDTFYEAYKTETDEATTGQDLSEPDLSEFLKDGLEQLSNVHREVLVLHFLEGMDYEEITLIAGCSLGTVKSRAFNAKQQLREIINTKISKQ